MTNKIWNKHPLVYEINTWPWLNLLSDINKSSINLSNIPVDIFREEFKNFDAIWLMGVWTRSPASKFIARTHSGLLSEYKAALKDFIIDDVVGSPYSIYEYRVEPNLGGLRGLKSFYNGLKAIGKKLILDFVPNHVSCDNFWGKTHPEYFINGTNVDLQLNPDTFFQFENNIYAHGKDPYFSAWTDTMQVNPFSSEFREQVIKTIKEIADYCDGVRCDMAMLLTNSVIQQTWGKRVGKPLQKEFWEEIIGEIKQKHPNFIFIAEVYWDMEWELMQQGFDFCYDKRLYDRLLHDTSENIRGHLHASWEYQSHLMRFIENHDEPRALPSFNFEKSLVAGMITLTLPGCRLLHYGQNLGFSIKLPVQIGRYPRESPNEDIMRCYKNILTILSMYSPLIGSWKLIETKDSLIAYYWKKKSNYFLVFCNYSDEVWNGSFDLKQIFDYQKLNEEIFVEQLFSTKYIQENEEIFKLDKELLILNLKSWEFVILKLSLS